MATDGDPVLVPIESLSPAALTGVVEAFVLREGTDYGASETAHEEKVLQVLAQLRRGEARIVYEPGSGAVDIVPATLVAHLE